MTNLQSPENQKLSLSEVLKSQGVDLDEGPFTDDGGLTMELVAEGIAALLDLQRQGIFPYNKPK